MYKSCIFYNFYAFTNIHCYQANPAPCVVFLDCFVVAFFAMARSIIFNFKLSKLPFYHKKRGRLYSDRGRCQ
jgi:hypothetical protein